MRYGAALSAAVHCGTALYLILGGYSFGNFKPPVVYSVTMESGSVLGGKAQVPDQKKTELAPAKNVAAKEQPQKIEPKSVKTKSEKATSDAEVSLAEKKKVKPTPKPTPKATQKKAAPAKSQPPPVDINKKLDEAVQRYLGESTSAGGKGFGAGSLGGKGFGGGVVRPPAFFAYKNLLENHIKGGWRWFDTSANLVAQVEFRLDKSGEITGVKLVKSSGNSEFDESAQRALHRANPAPRPPEAVFEFFQVVTITFDPRE